MIRGSKIYRIWIGKTLLIWQKNVLTLIFKNKIVIFIVYYVQIYNLVVDIKKIIFFKISIID